MDKTNKNESLSWSYFNLTGDFILYKAEGKNPTLFSTKKLWYHVIENSHRLVLLLLINRFTWKCQEVLGPIHFAKSDTMIKHFLFFIERVSFQHHLIILTILIWKVYQQLCSIKVNEYLAGWGWKNFVNSQNQYWREVREL